MFVRQHQTGDPLKIKTTCRGRLFRVAAYSLLAIFILGCAGCKTLVLPAFKPNDAEKYSFKQVKDGLVVAMQPMTNHDENRKYFGHDLLSADILPVLIVVTNQNDTDSFLVVRDKCIVQQANAPLTEKGTLAENGAAVSALGGTGIVLGLSHGAGLLATGGFLWAPMIIISAKLGSDATIIKHNMIVHEFQTHTLSQGESIFGFLYVQLPEDSPVPDFLLIRLEATHLKSRTDRIFDFALPIK